MVIEFLKKNTNWVIVGFLLLTLFGAYMTSHVNSKQTNEIEAFVQTHKAFHCVDGQLEFWQYDDKAEKFEKFKLDSGDNHIICIPELNDSLD